MAKRKHVNHVVMLLDETGSMMSIADEVVDGVNEFINGLRKDKGDKVLFTLLKFDSERFETVYDACPIKDVKPFTDYAPGAMTPLHDSIAKGIKRATDVKADSVLFAIYTDGQENYSREYKLADVRTLIDKHKAQGWQFTFLGADIDAYRVAGSYRLDVGSTISTTRAAFKQTVNTVSDAIGDWRGANVAACATTNYGYSEDQKRRAGDLGL